MKIIILLLISGACYSQMYSGIQAGGAFNKAWNGVYKKDMYGMHSYYAGALLGNKFGNFIIDYSPALGSEGYVQNALVGYAGDFSGAAGLHICIGATDVISPDFKGKLQLHHQPYYNGTIRLWAGKLCISYSRLQSIRYSDEGSDLFTVGIIGF